MEPAIEQSTRTLQIRALADNKQGRLIPGTYANITLPLDDINDALLVPTEAIIPIQNGKKVDPINFFFNDLTYDEYKEIIKISQSAINSMD